MRAQWCPTLCHPMDCSQASLSMGFPSKNTRVGCHFLLQGIFLLWDWISVSYVSCIDRQILYHCTTRDRIIIPEEPGEQLTWVGHPWKATLPGSGTWEASLRKEASHRCPPNLPHEPRRVKERLSLRHTVLYTTIMSITTKIQIREIVKKVWTKSQEAQALDPVITAVFYKLGPVALPLCVLFYLFIKKKKRLGKLSDPIKNWDLVTLYNIYISFFNICLLI